MNTRTSLESLHLARRIRAAGRQIYIEEDDRESTYVPSDGLLIYLFGEVNDSLATDFLGGTAFIINVNITINLPRFAISGFGLELEWNCTVDWLDDPSEGERPDVYRFGGRDLPEFERGQVLNHCADVSRIHSRGSSLRGYLLGVGDNPIPDHIQRGMMIPGFFIVYDQFLRPFRSPISLCANRRRKLLASTGSKASRKRIFDCSDPEYGQLLLESDAIDEKELVRANR